jgi:hypothetical protein
VGLNEFFSKLLHQKDNYFISEDRPNYSRFFHPMLNKAEETNYISVKRKNS